MKEMTVKRKLKRPEILAPAGTLEKLKTAIHYGADAVYIVRQKPQVCRSIYPLKLQQLILRHWNSGKKKGWNVSF